MNGAVLGERPCILKEANTFQGVAHTSGFKLLAWQPGIEQTSGIHIQWFSVIIKVDAYLADMKHSERGESPGISVK